MFLFSGSLFCKTKSPSVSYFPLSLHLQVTQILLLHFVMLASAMTLSLWSGSLDSTEACGRDIVYGEMPQWDAGFRCACSRTHCTSLVWQIPVGSVTQLSVHGCVSSQCSNIHCYWPAGCHHLQFLCQCSQCNGREQLCWQQCSTDHHHQGSVWSNHSLALKILYKI